MQALMDQTGAAEAGSDRQLERELVVRFAAGDESAFDAADPLRWLEADARTALVRCLRAEELRARLERLGGKERG